MYVAISALTWLLLGLVNVNRTPDIKIMIVTGGIFVLTIGALILRMGSYKYPSGVNNLDGGLADPDSAT